VETYGLLPANHFGARKQRSAEQALLLLRERIYTAWRGRKVVSLVSFECEKGRTMGSTRTDCCSG
jgi:hypothetical protein